MKPLRFSSLLAALLALALGGLLSSCDGGPAGDRIDPAAAAYQDGDMVGALKLVSRDTTDPFGRLVLHLSQIHCREKQDVDTGLAGLKKLYEDGATPARIRAQAALSYGRVIQLFQAYKQTRKDQPEYMDVDVTPYFEAVAKLLPSSPEACQAVCFQAEETVYDSDEKTVQKGFALLEGFLEEFKGEPANTVPVHLFLDILYVDLRRDYPNSVRRLKKAFELGISDDLLNREVLFRIARINDIKLNNLPEARKYYNLYLERYQYSRRKGFVVRYLKELDEKEVKSKAQKKEDREKPQNEAKGPKKTGESA